MVWYLCNTRENTSSHHWRRLAEASIPLSKWLRMASTVRISLIRSMPSCDSWSLRTVNSCETIFSLVDVKNSPPLISVSSMDSSMNSSARGMLQRENKSYTYFFISFSFFLWNLLQISQKIQNAPAKIVAATHVPARVSRVVRMTGNPAVIVGIIGLVPHSE